MIAREERRGKKRKRKRSRNPNSPPKKTGVWVTNLPLMATEQKIANVFSKAGVLMIGDDGEPSGSRLSPRTANYTGEGAGHVL